MYDRTIQMRKQNRHKKNGKLQKVKRNRAASLDIKRGFEFGYKKAFVNQ